MKCIFTLYLLIYYDSFTVSAQQNGGDGDQCGSQMETYRQCVKYGVTVKTLTKDQRLQLKNDIVQCFLNENCQNPFPDEQYLQATRSCFYKTRNESRRELETCVKRDIPGFILPQDEASGIEQMQLAVSLLTAARNPKTCPLLTNRNRLADCLKNSAALFESSSNQKGVDVCKVKQDCGSRVLSTDCKSTWNDKASPSLCRCINNNGGGMSNRYKQEYTNCVRDKGFTLLVNDPTQNMMESSINAWCTPPGTKDPCASSGTLAPTIPTIVTTPSAPKLVKPVRRPEKLPHPTDGTSGEEPTSQVEGSEYSGSTDLPEDTTTESTLTTVTTTTTTTELSTTATTLSNQNFFNALATDPLFQNLIDSSPGLKLLTNLFIGKTDLSAIFPSANLIGDFQIGLTNLFSNKLG